MIHGAADGVSSTRQTRGLVVVEPRVFVAAAASHAEALDG